MVIFVILLMLTYQSWVVADDGKAGLEKSNSTHLCQTHKKCVKNSQAATNSIKKTAQISQKTISQSKTPAMKHSLEKKQELASVPEKSSPKEPGSHSEKIGTTEINIPSGPQKREITVTNAVTPAMTAKRYLGYDYYPDSFSICINKEQFNDHEEKKVAIYDNRLLIEYNYNFRNGYRKGTRIVEFEIPESARECTLKFSWEQDSHVLIDNAKFISLKDV